MSLNSVDDTILPFQIGDTAIRGRVVRLEASVDRILSRHPFEDAVKNVLGEAIILVSMMGSSLKFDGRMIFQIQGGGNVSMLVADYKADGSVRATASVDENSTVNAHDSISALFGKGHIAITVDQGPGMERYQGLTPIEGDTLSVAAEAYFVQSEQIPTVVRLAVGQLTLPGQEPRWRAGGIIVQFVPSEGGDRERGEATINAPADQEAWDRAAAFLATTQDDELLDPDVSPQTLLYRLFHEDGVRVFDSQPVQAACDCHADKIKAVLSQYSKSDLEGMIVDHRIRATCEFCREDYDFSSDEILNSGS